ncbi:hypothetical protein QE152_g26049 [Popillia japonica]|uniref:Uncharacterized protein n=1 Tax=Popillia japonica TaxID=7064 RepID=A0AAW1JZU3_POPJA
MNYLHWSGESKGIEARTCNIFIGQEKVKALKPERVISSAAAVNNIDSPIVGSVLQEMAEREKRKSNLVISKKNGYRSDQISDDEKVKALKPERVISSAAAVNNIDSPIVGSVLQEMAEREKRKSNLVISKKNGYRSDQISDDVHPLRLGKFDPIHQHRKRPIKITLSYSGLVSSTLRESSKLKSIDKYKSIFLTNDKASFQSSIYKAVKEQLNQRIAANNPGN